MYDTDPAEGGDEQEDAYTGVTQEMIDAGHHMAYVMHGYVLQDGSYDWQRLRDKLYPLLAAAEVTSKQERADKAPLQSDAVTALFPNLPGPDAWENENDPELAQTVWKAVAGDIWRQLTPGPTGVMQRMVNANLDLILVRNKVALTVQVGGKPKMVTEHVAYVTRDLGCLIQDYQGPVHQRAKKAIEAAAQYTARAITVGADDLDNGFLDQIGHRGRADHVVDLVALVVGLCRRGRCAGPRHIADVRDRNWWHRARWPGVRPGSRWSTPTCITRRRPATASPWKPAGPPTRFRETCRSMGRANRKTSTTELRWSSSGWSRLGGWAVLLHESTKLGHHHGRVDQDPSTNWWSRPPLRQSSGILIVGHKTFK